MKAFENCLARGRLKAIEPDAERVGRELEKAREELERARAAFLRKNWDETVTQAYFAMSRCARAAINSRGYRDTNLYGLLIGIEHLFVETDEFPRPVIKQIRDAKDAKDAVYNGHRASAHAARNALQWSLLLAKEVFTRLSLPGFDVEEMSTALPEPEPTEQPEPDVQPDHNASFLDRREFRERGGRREWRGRDNRDRYGNRRGYGDRTENGLHGRSADGNRGPRAHNRSRGNGDEREPINYNR